jgi:thymidylate synthase
MSIVKSNSISDAWREAVALAITSPAREVISLIVNIECSGTAWPEEDLEFRATLNDRLTSEGKSSIETVARTIFPNGLWNPKLSRQAFYARFFRILPKLKKCRKNRNGHYFERLVDYPQSRTSAKKFNQLEHIINTYTKKGNHRRSALQATLVNPFLDAKHSRQLGFPCLHQVAFLPNKRKRTLRVVAYYPTHYLFERAYGNYLGLLYLGRFMAQEMKFSLEGLTCIAGVAVFEINPKELHFLRN